MVVRSCKAQRVIHGESGDQGVKPPKPHDPTPSRRNTKQITKRPLPEADQRWHDDGISIVECPSRSCLEATSEGLSGPHSAQGRRRVCCAAGVVVRAPLRASIPKSTGNPVTPKSIRQVAYPGPALSLHPPLGVKRDRLSLVNPLPSRPRRPRDPTPWSVHPESTWTYVHENVMRFNM
jgi:hypothetical protein